MNANPTQLRSYVYLVLAIFLTFYGIVLGKPFLAPLSYGFVFALLLLPLCNWIERWLPNRIIATILGMVIVLIPLMGLILLFSWRSVSIFQELEFVNAELQALLSNWLDRIGQLLNMGEEEGRNWLMQNVGRLLEMPIQLLGTGLYSSTTLATGLLMSIIFALFFLLYRSSFPAFFEKLLPEKEKGRRVQTLQNIRHVVREFLVGRLTVMLILAILNSLGLWLIGVKYALFWGLLGAFFTIIPYIGTAIGGLLPTLYAGVSGDYWWQPFSVILMYGFLQFVEGNFITPKVMGDTVELNPFIVIIALFAGGLLWGFSGVVLAVPIIAILKVALEGSSRWSFLSAFLSSSSIQNPSSS